MLLLNQKGKLFCICNLLCYKPEWDIFFPSQMWHVMWKWHKIMVFTLSIYWPDKHCRSCSVLWQMSLFCKLHNRCHCVAFHMLYITSGSTSLQLRFKVFEWGGERAAIQSCNATRAHTCNTHAQLILLACVEFHCILTVSLPVFVR